MPALRGDPPKRFGNLPTVFEIRLITCVQDDETLWIIGSRAERRERREPISGTGKIRVAWPLLSGYFSAEGVVAGDQG